MNIKELALIDLIPSANNSRTHSSEQIAQVAASIEAFGFINPVIIDKDKGIIAGHCRILAAEQLGLDKVPCLVVSHLSEDQKKAFIIADNKLALNSSWDDALLASVIGELSESGFNIDLLGFSADELDNLLPGEEVDIDFDKDEGRSGATIPYLTIAGTKIPLTEEEHQQLARCLDNYVEENGAFFGFASHLLGLNHA